MPGTSFAWHKVVWVLLLSCSFGECQNAQDLTNLNIEDLMNIKVTSVSKKDQSILHTASAVFVITQDDIRRSGATNIPDLLRMVPGVNIAQINANKWAISVRGLNALFSNKLLVMIDGRSVYSPSFGGVFWDVLDVPLENIERIEVIRGPGGTIWGANAVNGVINIITKKAADSKGALIVAGTGNVYQEFGLAQFGGRLRKSTDYRIYAKYHNQDDLPGSTNPDGNDGWHMLRGGFRSDSKITTKDELTFQGDVYRAREGLVEMVLPSIIGPGPIPINAAVNEGGGFLRSSWNHSYSERSETSLQASYESYARNFDARERRQTFNMDFQHHVRVGNRHDVVWGAGYRFSVSEVNGTGWISLNPAKLSTQLSSAFVQDEINLVPSRLNLIVGAKFEHNFYTHLNISPSVRLVWTPDEHSAVWAAVSNAVRTPAATDTSVRVNLATVQDPSGMPVLVSLFGNPSFLDEGLTAYEAGYRRTYSTRISIDLAAFYNRYSNLSTTEPAAVFLESSPSPAHLVAPVAYGNLMHGETHGFELAAKLNLTDRWTLSPGYAFEQVHMHLDPSSLDTTAVLGAEGSSPVHAAQLRSHLALSSRWEWDVSAYFSGRLVAPNTPSYTKLDSTLSWRWTEGLSVSLVGQNLLRDRHLEFVDTTGAVSTSLIKRSVYAKFVWHF